MMADEKTTLADKRELFSFGSGQWYDGEDARDALESSASCIPCRMNLDSMIILEKKRIPSHLSQLACLEKPTALRTLLTSLEDLGEAGKQTSETLRQPLKSYPFCCSFNLGRSRWA